MRIEKRLAFLRDIDRIAAYISRDNPDAAFRFITASEKSAEMLAAQPHLGHQEKFRRYRRSILAP